MKILAKLILRCSNNIVLKSFDSLQFTGRLSRFVDEGVATSSALQHFNIRKTVVRLDFLDHSLAFNTIKPARIVKKVADLGFSLPLVTGHRQTTGGESG